MDCPIGRNRIPGYGTYVVIQYKWMAELVEVLVRLLAKAAQHPGYKIQASPNNQEKG
jgi:hypothetical protein